MEPFTPTTYGDSEYDMTAMPLDELGEYAGYDYYNYDYQVSQEAIVEDSIGLYGSPVLLLCAIVGNTVSAIVMAQFGFGTLSSCLYLAILSVVDLIQVLIRVGNVWTKKQWSMDLTNKILLQSNVSCQVRGFEVLGALLCFTSVYYL
jgi:hypothetical protein